MTAPGQARPGPLATGPISAVGIAKLLGQKFAPTAQQAAVIEAPVAPLLVVAGAGSGKTETMAARVVWLVANGYVEPEQVLGLTFTRKAAGELGLRIRKRLAQLHAAKGPRRAVTGDPEISTYHAYAAKIVREHGMRAGYERADRMLTEAACWQLADAVVRGYDGDMSAVRLAPSSVTDAVVHLAAELNEHLRTPDELAAWTGRFFAEVQQVPGRVPKPVLEVLDRAKARLQLLPLVRAYAQRKARAEAMDFGDQLARAAAIASGCRQVPAIERDRYRVVLLDEYQDTSHAQVELLASLFGDGHPVTAVGDPCQSIYGWRGASAGTLDRFPTRFAMADGRPAGIRSLTTSWRNRPEILDVANAVSMPLRDRGARVAELAPSDLVEASFASGTVRCALLETSADEADWIARRILAAWQERSGAEPGTPGYDIPVDDRPSTAVLVRTRAQFTGVEQALRAAGLPVEVVGLGGLLDTPEVRDVVSTLTVLADPAEGAALLRLLTGPRWRIGPRDLVALYRRARQIAVERWQASVPAGSGAAGGDPATAPANPAPTDPGPTDAALVEALDDLGDPGQYSAQGHRRFAALAQELRILRRHLDQSLPDLVAEVERRTGLDVEVAVRTGDAGLGRAHLDAFGAVAARFSGDAEHATLSGFLAYLAAAEDSERGLAPGQVEVVKGAVQVLTVHAAKGLEWDIVAVAGLTDGVFPGASNAGDHWLRGVGVLPFPLRGDADGLPVLDLSAAEDQRGVARALDEFATAWREHDVREERRLAYVAVTRPKALLLVSGYWWAEGLRKRRGPSDFLTEIFERCRAGAGVVDHWEADPGPDAENPMAASSVSGVWPGDPLGSRRPRMRLAAEQVVAAGRSLPPEPGPGARAGIRSADPAVAVEGSDDPLVLGWAKATTMLLAEQRQRDGVPGSAIEVELPGHLSVSQLVEVGRDPAVVAMRLRRPMPRRPSPAARRGTRFHAWLEQRFTAERLLDLDEWPGAADAAGDPELAGAQGSGPAGRQPGADDDLRGDLRDRFMATAWAHRDPIEVEVPFTTVIGGLVVRGRIDAVYSDGRGGYEIVDWKTGVVAEEEQAGIAAIQLSAYRLAWARLAGVPIERVVAAFVYVRSGATVYPDLLDEDALTAMVTALPVAGR